MYNGTVELAQFKSNREYLVDIDALMSRLNRCLSAVLGRSRDVPRRGFLSVTIATPELIDSHYLSLIKEDLYWARPNEQHYRVGNGKVALTTAYGRRRFLSLNEAFSTLRSTWIALDPDRVAGQPSAFVGFSFSSNQASQLHWREFANAVLFVPTVLFERKGATCHVTFSHQWDGVSDPDQVRQEWLKRAQGLIIRLVGSPLEPASRGPLVRDDDGKSDHDWVSRVTKALKAIHEGVFDKVVLTRRVQVSTSRGLQPGRVLASLQNRYPGCVQFAVGGDKHSLVGVSPERLVSLNGEHFVADALGGTAPRDPEARRDGRHGADLLSSDKARQEHSLVVEDIGDALEPLSHGLQIPVSPRLLKLPTLQHLWSPIQGRIKPGVSLLQLAARLHPTAAVGGAPRSEALEWLVQNGEEGWRGWYTGALGWLTRDGGGELSVVLRCALLNDCEAELFAGSGIVAGSEPTQELVETEWKLRTMLEAVTVC